MKVELGSLFVVYYYDYYYYYHYNIYIYMHMCIYTYTYTGYVHVRGMYAYIYISTYVIKCIYIDMYRARESILQQDRQCFVHLEVWGTART